MSDTLPYPVIHPVKPLVLSFSNALVVPEIAVPAFSIGGPAFANLAAILSHFLPNFTTPGLSKNLSIARSTLSGLLGEAQGSRGPGAPGAPGGSGLPSGPSNVGGVFGLSFHGSFGSKKPGPVPNPGILSLIIPEISGEYFAVIFAGITASPGESIAGIMSPAPFGPGTDTTPVLYFLGFTFVCIP